MPLFTRVLKLGRYHSVFMKSCFLGIKGNKKPFNFKTFRKEMKMDSCVIHEVI